MSFTAPTGERAEYRYTIKGDLLTVSGPELPQALVLRRTGASPSQVEPVQRAGKAAKEEAEDGPGDYAVDEKTKQDIALFRVSVLGPLVDVTIRGLLGRRRILLVGLLAMSPVGVALILVLGGGSGASAEDLRQLYDSLVMTTVVPLVALILGTTAIGAEIDDGTVIHLLARPVGRSWIVLAKMLVAATSGVMLCGTSALLTGLLLVGLDVPRLVLGMLGGTAVAVADMVEANKKGLERLLTENWEHQSQAD